MICSIVMPVYNGAAFLDAALDSIFAQSVADFELIVIDDGSTDETAAILTKRTSDSRLRILTNDRNLGIVFSLNRGVAAAKTDLIVRFDGDDIMMPNRLECQLAFMQQHPSIGGAGSYWYITDEHDRDCGKFEWPITTVEKMNQYIDHGGNPVYPHPAMILRKHVVEAVGGYREEFRKCEDVDLFLRMIMAGYPLLIQPEYLIKFRSHSTSTSATSGRYQEELNEFLFANFRLHRQGLPEIALADFRAKIAGQSTLSKLTREIRFFSRLCMRRRTDALRDGQKVFATTLLLTAAACNPSAIVSKIRRTVTLRAG